MRQRLRLLVVAALCAVSAMAPCQHRRLYLSSFAGQSIVFLGSTDPRRGSGLGLAYDLGPERRLRWGPHSGTLMVEAYYDFTKSPGVRRTPPNSAQAWGLFAMSRYKWTEPNAPTSFIDVGWGLQIASRTTRDLESKLNSTPVLDFGLILGRDREVATVAARFLHVSNAGTVGDNRGQNQLYLLVQIPF